jgi:hypothetical protein
LARDPGDTRRPRSDNPRASYGRGVHLEDAADNLAVGEHVEIVIISARLMGEKQTRATCAF